MQAGESYSELVVAVVVAALTYWCAARGPGVPFAVVASLGGLAGFVVVGHPAFPLMTLVLSFALWRTSCRRAPGWDIARQFGYVGAGLLFYTTARRLIEGSYADAHANAMRVLDFERGLGLHFEPGFQAWLTQTEVGMRAMNDVYSFAYLPAIGAALLWLYARDQRAFRVLRNALGLSTLIALATIAALPVAPPRLVPEAEMFDTVVVLGREHSFANEYAAIPSFHVGWTALAGYAVSLTLTGWQRVAMAWLPGLAMLVIVIGTGNHYWIDGVVGVAFSVGPAMLMVHGVRGGVGVPARAAAAAVHRAVLGIGSCVTGSPKSLFTSVTLGALLAFLVVGELVAPGFTAFWGYLVAQMAVTLVLLVGAERIFRDQGGISWATHIIAVLTGYADTFGTAGDLYANIAEYDKITHFAGVAAVTAGAYDCLRAGYLRGHRSWLTEYRLAVAIVAGVAMGGGWELYELFGDEIFATKRVQGRLDTAYDLVFDTLGAVVAGFLLARLERRAGDELGAWAKTRVAPEKR
ncbi:MAG: phosphatase PAP2 family protein [Dehalococcoidia bacterium]|nr:phosphatase PAP2 family protein [Dehalococcoidia bacterium]